jgi:hypothetical protein
VSVDDKIFDEYWRYRTDTALPAHNTARRYMVRAWNACVWSEVVALPNRLMHEARRKDNAPIKAAVSAQLAFAVGILTFAPVRLGNLVSIELGQNLIKPGGVHTPHWLVSRTTT